MLKEIKNLKKNNKVKEAIGLSLKFQILIKETALIGTYKNKTKSTAELKTIKCILEPYEEVIKRY